MPKVSILLPIYRNNEDGLLHSVLASIRSQTFKEWELIIVDDASTDGSAVTAARFMADDERIGIITHEYNIGLPAISEYEAFKRARGTHFMFAFDDVVFKKNAVETLYSAALSHPRHFVHGEMEMALAGGAVTRLSRGKKSYSLLLSTNFIGNSSVILEREAIEEVGLYDPHVIASRTCDWDLWRRMLKHYPAHDTKALIATEHGLSREGSLGNTYPIHSEVMQEYYSLDRDALLRPNTFEEFDVWSAPKHCSSALAISIDRVRRHFSSKFWGEDGRNPPAEVIKPTRKVISVIGYLDASTMALFEAASEHQDGPAVLFIEPDHISNHHLLDFVAVSDAVVIVRNLRHRQSMSAIEICENLSIPIYYCIDDNLMLLADTYRDEIGEYSTEVVRTQLASFSGVLTASQKLREYFIAESIHKNIQVIKSGYSEKRFLKCRSMRPAASETLKVGFLGGEFREESLRLHVIPALSKIAHTRQIELFVRQGALKEVQSTGFRVHEVPFSPEYDEFLTSWSQIGLDIIAHPHAKTPNAPYKADSIILNSHYLGAVPIVPKDEPAFSTISDGDGVLRVGASEDDWHKAIEDATKSAARGLDAFVGKNFSASSAAKTLEMLTPRDPITATDLIMRYERLRAVHPYVQRTPRIALPPKPTLEKDHEREARIKALIELKRNLATLNRSTPFEADGDPM